MDTFSSVHVAEGPGSRRPVVQVDHSCGAVEVASTVAAPRSTPTLVMRISPALVGVGLAWGIDTVVLEDALRRIDLGDRSDSEVDLASILDDLVIGRPTVPTDGLDGVLLAHVERGRLRLAAVGDGVVVAVADPDRRPRVLTRAGAGVAHQITAVLVAGSAVAVVASGRSVPSSTLSQTRFTTHQLAAAIAEALDPDEHAVVVARCVDDDG